MMMNGKYIQFADPVVKQICIANFSSDGIGVTYEDAAAVTSIRTLFQNASIVSFNELRFFTGLTGLSSSCFSDCSDLVSIVIPASVTEIGQSAFASCTGLASLTIPDSVAIIGSYAIYKKNGMSVPVTMLPTTPPTLGLRSLDGASVIYVPAACEAAYKAAWPDYESKIQAIQ